MEHMKDHMTIKSNYVPRPIHGFPEILTSNDESHRAMFLRILPSSCYDLAVKLLSDLDLFLEIFKDPIGFKSIMTMLGQSPESDGLLFNIIMKTFKVVLILKSSDELLTRLLQVLNPLQVRIFCHHVWFFALTLAHDENGCVIVKRALTISNDTTKARSLESYADKAYELSKDELGISVINHALQLDFTLKSTQDHPRLHELMAEFDDEHILEFCSKMTTSDDDLFLDFVKTARGSLIVQIILRRTEVADDILFEAVMKRFVDVVTHRFASNIVLVFVNRPNQNMRDQIYAEMVNVVNLSTSAIGSKLVRDFIGFNKSDLTKLMLRQLKNPPRYLELSFDEHGSKVVAKLIYNEDLWLWAMTDIAKEFLDSNEDKLMRLAEDDYGNKIFMMALETAKEKRMYWYKYLVVKARPLARVLRGTKGDNVAAFVESEAQRLRLPSSLKWMC